jgi:hypothetical protein
MNTTDQAREGPTLHSEALSAYNDALSSEAASHLFARLQSAQLRTGLDPLDRLIKFSPGQIQFIQVSLMRYYY